MFGYRFCRHFVLSQKKRKSDVTVGRSGFALAMVYQYQPQWDLLSSVLVTLLTMICMEIIYRPDKSSLSPHRYMTG